MAFYNHLEIEPKWQAQWEKDGVGRVTEQAGADALYHLVMFPYPSGAGLHVGHVESYAALDIVTRKARMQGKNVLFPMGFDAFGLPAENYAVKTGTHPSETTEKAIATFRRQLKSIGLSFDWSREISTCDPSYYKWTQWLFLLFYKNDLAYRAKAPVNWCDGCNTVLANEQVVDGACERCSTVVVQKELEQWFFRITKYADRLLAGIDSVDWPERIKSMQRHWIGRKEGVNITYEIEGRDTPITVFTTRPDTNFGATFITAAPDGEFVRQHLMSFPHAEEVVRYCEAAGQKTERDRVSEGRIKTGVFTGWYAVNNLTGRRMPVYVGDFVLGNFGTGVVVGVPGHDTRDFEFAQAMGLDVVRVVVGADGDVSPITRIEQVQEESGTMVNSGFLDGMDIHNATKEVADYIEQKGWGRRVVTYHLRDWLVSRQRYWGAPIPIVWCSDCGAQPVDPKDLPVLLPRDVDFKPTGQSPLVDSKTFHDVVCPKCGGAARRESDTMDTFVDSSWYYLRYTDAHNDAAFADPDKLKFWCPVDLYVGGAEHAVMHLLYARFFAYALHDLGYADFEEPFLKLRNQGLILGPDGEKMSKSKGNVVNPDDVVEQYGADSIRLYEMFMGPLEDEKPWDTKGIVGIRRFLDRTWSLRLKVVDQDNPDATKLVHKAVKKVTEDIDAMKFNTAISAMMICLNGLAELDAVPRRAYEMLVLVLAPFAPHLAEEIWHDLGHAESVFAESWPQYDEDAIKEDFVTIVVQVNGKPRATIDLSPDLPEKDVQERALAIENVQKFTDGKEIVKVIFVPGRLINIVVK